MLQLLMSHVDETDGFSSADEKLCSVEATAAVKEVAFGVKHIAVASNTLPFSDSIAYINITTLEDEKMCVEVSAKGFCPVAKV